MKARKVFPHSHLPTQLPVYESIIAWLVLDRLNSPGWAVGVTVTLFALSWIGMLARWWHEKTTPLAGYGDEDK